MLHDLILEDRLYAYYNLSVHDLRGQRYARASNVRGEWNELHTLILKGCLYACYIYCVAHRLGERNR